MRLGQRQMQAVQAVRHQIDHEASLNEALFQVYPGLWFIFYDQYFHDVLHQPLAIVGAFCVGFTSDRPSSLSG